MSFEEKGAYMDLLMMQFHRGHMTDHMVGQLVGQIWLKVQHKFKKDADGLWFNERIDQEKAKRQNFVNSRNNNLSGVNQYSKKTVKTGKLEVGHTTSRMVNENININKDIDKDNKKEEGEELDKKLQLETRRAEFYRQVLAKKDYDQNMLIAFADYWAEANRSGTRMRFELEKTWELDRRLVTWDSRDKQFNRKPNEKGYHATDF